MKHSAIESETQGPFLDYSKGSCLQGDHKEDIKCNNCYRKLHQFRRHSVHSKFLLCRRKPDIAPFDLLKVLIVWAAIAHIIWCKAPDRMIY